jgi:chorismate synthase
MPGVGDIEIRDVQSFSEYNDCVDVQRKVWAFPEADLVPAAHLVVMHHYGGVCIGAFDQQTMVGFVCGLVGWREGRIFHHSHMVGVLPAYRGRRLGEKLKWAQRDRVLAQGMNLITWTYDPLQAPNAHFNINRLGAVPRKYLVNVYGESVSPLHGGIPTDRFEIQWWIESPRVQEMKGRPSLERPGWESLPRVNRATVVEGQFPRCEDPLRLDLEEREILVEIPGDITSIMAEERELAIDWRMKTRQIFQVYFERGYAVEGFHRSNGRTFYRLEKPSARLR